MAMATMAMVSCTEEEQPPTVSYVFTDVSVEAGQTSASIKCRNSSVDDENIHASVLLSKNENITDATKYPLRLLNDTLRGTINGLEQNTMYYFCFEVYTANEHKRTDEVFHFQTTGGGEVTVTTSEAINVTQTTVTGGGSVSANGSSVVGLRGVCWDTIHNPNIVQSPHLVNGEGTGSFMVNITGLTSGTTYYMRAYALCDDVVYYGNQVTFKTTQNTSVPTVTTSQVTNVTQTSAKGGGNVTDDGGATVTERGISWSTSHSPTVSGSHAAASSGGTGSYTVNMTGLTANTTYYVRAYATNSQGTSYGSEVSFKTTQNTSAPTVTTSAVTNVTQTSAKGHGNVTADGGTTVTERGVCWCTSHNPTTSGSHASSGTGTGSFTSSITGLTANTTYYVRAYAVNSAGTAYGEEVSFTSQQVPSYTVSVSANPANGGTVTGGGTYQQGQSCTVSATANSGYTFTNWSENGNVVSTSANYTFTVNTNRTLVANFTYNGGGNAPTGAINGLFSVSATQQVYFSQGNLQYQASTNTWRFAENQYDYVGNANSSISSSYNGWIDLFGWGTSGWNNGNTYYHPWDSDNTNGSLYGPPGQYDLNGSYANADWGVYNPISNGGNTANQWRTLTIEEWEYVFNTRTTTSDIRYAKAKVNNVNGVILLPDNWSASTYSLSSPNSSGASFSSNTITASQWTTLESAGAVFLPAAGYRYGTSVSSVGSYGYYWSASGGDSSYAFGVYFHDSYLSTGNHANRYDGRSVRLVRVAEN